MTLILLLLLLAFASSSLLDHSLCTRKKSCSTPTPPPPLSLATGGERRKEEASTLFPSSSSSAASPSPSLPPSWKQPRFPPPYTDLPSAIERRLLLLQDQHYSPSPLQRRVPTQHALPSPPSPYSEGCPPLLLLLLLLLPWLWYRQWRR